MTVLQQLRAETRPYHDALEARLGLANVPAERAPYAALLGRFYGLYEPFERVIPAYGADPTHWLDGDRRKLPLLASDLDHLDVGTEGLELCAVIPAAGTLPRQLGCMYVIEGSTLGGQVLRGRFGGISDRPVTAFFTSYGPRVGAMWRAFCARLGAFDGDAAATRAIVDAAVETFQTFHDWLCLSTTER